ncbi:DUF4340 domain-containing protein [Candidatus Latescibacterota bacterium]
MKIVKALAVLIAVVGFGAYVYFGVYKTEEQRKVDEEEQRHLVRFEIDRISKFVLARPDSSITFERSIGRLWNITEPIKAEADGKPLYTLFNSLNQTDILVTVEDKPKDISPYGLTNPDYFLAMEYDVGDSDTLFLGTETPDGMMSYVKFASENRVVAVTKQLTDILKRPVVKYRARTILNVLADDITSIEIFRTKDGVEDRINLFHNEVIWMMNHPWKLPADQSNMEDLTKKLAESNKKSLEVELAGNLAKYGLDKPTTVVNVKLKYGMPDKMILVGNRLTEKGKKHLWYAKQFDKDLVFTIENSVVTLLTRIKTWFIDKQPMKVNRNAIDKIVLETSGSSVIFMRDAEKNWSVVSPIDKNLKQETINSIFAVSRFMLINDIVAIEPTQEQLDETGVSKPTSVINFYQGDRLMVRAEYGKTFMTEKENTYVRTSLSPILYITSSTVNSSLNEVLNTVFSGQ